METLFKYKSSHMDLYPAPSALLMKLKSKDLLYLPNPRICGLSLEQNQVLGPARRVLSARCCDEGQIYHTVSLNGSATACAADVTIGISGHGFFMASESLTTHPSGPGMQPMRLVSLAKQWWEGLVADRSIQLSLSPRQLS